MAAAKHGVKPWDLGTITGALATEHHSQPNVAAPPVALAAARAHTAADHTPAVVAAVAAKACICSNGDKAACVAAAKQGLKPTSSDSSSPDCIMSFDV